MEIFLKISETKSFISAREVARHTAAVANPALAQRLQSSTLVKAKNEVLRLIELLSEKMPNEISDLLGEVKQLKFDVSFKNSFYA